MSKTRPAIRKQIFDGLRRLLGRGFTQSEVDNINHWLDVRDKNSDIACSTVKKDDTDSADSDTFDSGYSDTWGAKDDTLTRKSDTLGRYSDTRAAQIDRILDLALDRVPGVPSVPRIKRSKRPPHRLIGEAGTALIKRFEGCARLRRDGMVEAYPDPGSGGEPWTIGWGATGRDDCTGSGANARIGPDTVWTQAQCDERLARDLVRYARDVARAIGDAPTTQDQFDAMVSFHYNTGAIGRATLTRKHVAGDHAGAAAEFARWNRAGSRVLKGLVRRRAEEARLYSRSARQ